MEVRAFRHYDWRSVCFVLSRLTSWCSVRLAPSLCMLIVSLCRGVRTVSRAGRGAKDDQKSTVELLANRIALRRLVLRVFRLEALAPRAAIKHCALSACGDEAQLRMREERGGLKNALLLLLKFI
jgi:hypothetical protein